MNEKILELIAGDYPMMAQYMLAHPDSQPMASSVCIPKEYTSKEAVYAECLRLGVTWRELLRGRWSLEGVRE